VKWIRNKETDKSVKKNRIINRVVARRETGDRQKENKKIIMVGSEMNWRRGNLKKWGRENFK
jgi:hypothetical protein